MEEGELALLKEKYNTDNQSEAIRLAISECLLNEDKEKIKTLFHYVGKKPPRIGKEVAEAFKQSGCSLFVDLFCGSIAMLCYLPWNTAVVVNDINGNLTNLYMVIRDSPSVFISELIKLPYSELLFQKLNFRIRVRMIFTGSLGQLVHRRDNIMKQRTRLVNQLHEQICIAYPSYKQFFNDISRPTSLYFW